MDWFRSYHGAPTDAKWLAIAKRASVRPGDVAAVFWALLDYASQRNDRGSVDGFDCETVAGFYGYEESEVEAIIAAMTSKGIINDGRLACWERRQPKREDDSQERTRRYRERQNAKPETPPDGDGQSVNVTHSDATVTHGDDREEQSRVEQNREEREKRASAPDERKLWFEGKGFRVDKRTFENWLERWPLYGNLWDQLGRIDPKIAAKGLSPSEAFFMAEGWLEAGHKKLLRERSPPEPLRAIA